MAKSKTVKFEVDQLVEFDDRFGHVSRIAKNGAIYVIVLGETTVLNETREELRVKKAALRLASDMAKAIGMDTDAAVADYVNSRMRQRISNLVTARVQQSESGSYVIAPEYIPSLDCLKMLDWEGGIADESTKKNWGIDLLALATEYTGKKTQCQQTVPKGWDKIESEAQQEIESEACADAAQQEIEEIDTQQEIESDAAQQEIESAVTLADATYALRELTFSVTRHSILTAFIDVVLNKDIVGYHHRVASNIKNLMAASFDPVHDSVGYARINTWTMAALGLLVKNKDRVAKMLTQPIEAAPIKLDRVTKLGLWIDHRMRSEGPKVTDMTSAYDSCYVYDALGKKLEACMFVVVKVTPEMKSDKITMMAIPPSVKQEFSKHLTAQSAIAVRKQHIDYWRQLEPDLSSYCGIVPILKTGRTTREAIEDTLASVINSLKLGR